MIIIILTVEILWLLTPQTKIPPTYFGLPDDDDAVIKKSPKSAPVMLNNVGFEDPQMSDKSVPPKMSICGCEN